MRILIAIPHYFEPVGRAPDGAMPHGSLRGDIRPRLDALAACIAAFHGLYGDAQYIIDIKRKVGLPANGRLAGEVHVVVCTTRGRHLLDRLTLPEGAYGHRPTDAEPRLLGFECHAALRDRLGDYDYYGFAEDDLIARDPWFFAKLAWFNGHLGDAVLLQPNRFEVAPAGVARKAYIDGDLDEVHTAKFQDTREAPLLRSAFLNVDVAFRRPSNPHSGCFFLNARQMAEWARRPDFLDRDTGFIGPLESAASLGIMRAFRVYKPAPENAAFLEIEHSGTGFVSQLRRRGAGE